MKALSVWIAMGVTLLGCSSSSSNGAAASCGKVEPCGGDIVGTWTIVAACAAPTSAGGDTACPGETAQVGSYSASGTATFNSDMTYTIAVTESASETITIPMSCLTSGTTTVTCAELTAELGGSLDDAGMETTNCTTSGSNCNCTIVLSGQSTNDTGTYTVSGDTFTTTSTTTTGNSGGGNYCVQGNTLHVISTAMGMGTAIGTPAADLVATK